MSQGKGRPLVWVSSEWEIQDRVEAPVTYKVAGTEQRSLTFQGWMISGYYKRDPRKSKVGTWGGILLSSGPYLNIQTLAMNCILYTALAATQNSCFLITFRDVYIESKMWLEKSENIMPVNCGYNLCHQSVQDIATFITLDLLFIEGVLLAGEMPFTQEENNSLSLTLVFE